MPSINRYRCSWSLLPGSPGVSTFYVSDNASTSVVVNALKTFFGAINSYFPAPCQIATPTLVDTVNSDTGALVGGTTAPSLAATVGTATNYAGGSGAEIVWGTNAVVGRKKVRGRTFIVPLASTGYDTSGQVSTTVQAIMSAAAAALVTALSPNFGVWSRPTATRSGAFNQVQTGACSRLAVVLTSRRT